MFAQNLPDISVCIVSIFGSSHDAGVQDPNIPPSLDGNLPSEINGGAHPCTNDGFVIVVRSI